MNYQETRDSQLWFFTTLYWCSVVEAVCTRNDLGMYSTHHHDVREAELVGLRPRDLPGAAAAHSGVLEGHDEALEHGGTVESVVIGEHGDLRVHVSQTGVHSSSLTRLGLLHHTDDGSAGVHRFHDVEHLSHEVQKERAQATCHPKKRQRLLLYS